ncbi:MAG: hypothetical protein ACRC44_00040 [Bifidobacterium asteroides]
MFAFVGLILALSGIAAYSWSGADCGDQVRYLSEKDPAYLYLENRQREVYEANPGIADPLSRAELNKPGSIVTIQDVADILSRQGCDESGQNCVGDKELYNYAIKRIRCADIPTRFESPLLNSIIATTEAYIVGILRSEYGYDGRIRFGSLPTGTIDAEALRVPETDIPIVIVNRDLFFFTGAFSKSISAAIPVVEIGGRIGISRDRDAIAERIREHPEIAANFAEAMFRMVQRGSPRGAPEVLLDADHNRLHARLVTAMDIFLIAHEYGHVVLGHTAKGTASYAFGSKIVAASSQPQSGSGGPTIDFYLRSHDDELSADAFGYRVTLRATLLNDGNRVDGVVTAAAPSALFRIIDAADKYARAATGAGFSDAAHPTADDRRKNLDAIFQEMSAPDQLLYGEPDMRVTFDTAIDVLISVTDGAVRRKLGIEQKE